MLKHFGFLSKLSLVFSLLFIVSCNSDFDPPPVAPQPVTPGMNGEIHYNLSGTDISCIGIPSAIAALTITDPNLWFFGSNFDIDVNNPAATTYTHRLDIFITNVTNIHDLVGMSIPTESEVANVNTDIYISDVAVTLFNSFEVYEFDDFDLNITSINSANEISGTFSGTGVDPFTGVTKTITNGQIINVYYGVEQ